MEREIIKIINEINIFDYYNTPSCYKEIVEQAWKKIGREGTPNFTKLWVGKSKFYYKPGKPIQSNIIHFLAESVVAYRVGYIPGTPLFIVFMYDCTKNSIFGLVEKFYSIIEAKFKFSKDLAIDY